MAFTTLVTYLVCGREGLEGSLRKPEITFYLVIFCLLNVPDSSRDGLDQLTINSKGLCLRIRRDGLFISTKF
jgi:hypothetical protein